MNQHTIPGISDTIGSAIFSPCRRWRYDLWRYLDNPGDRMIAFIGLNPSTADESKNDSTIRRCIDFAQRWGYGTIHMLNLFAWRSTDPYALLFVADAEGPENDEYIAAVTRQADTVVACWGNHGRLLDRDGQVMQLLDPAKLHHLGRNKNGTPKHPLYLPGDSELIPWDQH